MPDDNIEISKPLSTTDTKTVTVQIENGENTELEKRGLDPALQFLGAADIEFTPEESRKVLSKIDWVLMPLLCWVYLIQFADKTSLNYASLMGIREDTHLAPKSQQYSWVSSIFYAGFMFWEFVSYLHTS